MGTIRSIAAIAAAVAALAHAAPPPITLRPVASGLFEPSEIAFARDGSGRLYVTELNGRVRIVRDGMLLPQPFLDISAQVSVAGERGLLGLAFDPRYRFNGKFYVMYTTLPDDTVGGSLRLSQFRRSSTNPDLADPASERIVIEIPHPGAANHNAGKLAFAYGLLHMATGDGGGAGDGANNAQNLGVRLGKILRFCVECASWSDQLFAGYNENRPPTDAHNPILMYGLRNPWRFSFDRVTGDMYIADVGQGTVEEIDFLPALDAVAGGQNMGWRVLEGNNCFNPATAGCQSSLTAWPPTALHPGGWLDYRAPVLTYLHDAQGGVSVTGGFVYRGLKSSQLRGYYIYGDYGSSRIWAARRENGSWVTTPVSEAPNGISGLSTFGEDEDGELYVASLGDGVIYAIDGPPDAVPSRNVALARNGATVTASSETPGFAAANAIDGDRLGNYWGPGVAWIAASNGPRPDTLQVDFGRTETIERVAVVGYVREFPGEGYEPYETTSCGYTPKDFDVRARVAGAWTTVGSIRGNRLCIRNVAFAAVDADAIQLVVLAAPGGAVIAEIEAWTPPRASAPAPPPALVNVALAANGAMASASSTYSAAFPPSAAINGDRAGMNWGSGSGWNDATVRAFPDWLQVDFAQSTAIEEVVVYSLQDDPFHPAEPTDTMTFGRYGLTDFTVEGWNGTGWTVLATVTGNNLVKRRVAFAPFNTPRVRVNVGRALDVYSHIVEVEAFGTLPLATTNYALASMGAMASASSSYGPGFPPSAAIDGDRAGMNWGAGSGWNDGTLAVYPDILQVDLAMPRTLDHVTVYTLQDNPYAPSEPTDAMTFSSYGILNFTVEGWNGSAWTVLGTVIGNNHVKRTVTFPPFMTGSIRINVTGALGGYSHITEVEAFGF